MRPPQQQRGRLARQALRLAVLAAAAPVITAVAAGAAPSRAVVIGDPPRDVASPLDLQRVALQRASDGRLRAAVTFAAKVTPSALLATSGPPGSVCLRIWTDAKADPLATRPDRLACVTARSATALRAGVFEQRDAGMPRRVAAASVTRTSSGRSIIVRIAQSSLGRPALIRFAAESTRAGCERPACVDTAPAGGAVRRLRLR